MGACVHVVWCTTTALALKQKEPISSRICAVVRHAFQRGAGHLSNRPTSLYGLRRVHFARKEGRGSPFGCFS